jgi:RHS repeat-associated protein
VNYEKLQYYYHADHLGSSSYITNLDGEIVQHVEYVPFGEVFIEERNNTWNTPYLFNGKELDEETGLYYYGARYYNPRESVWLSVDALASYNPFEQENFIDGQHNGGVYNSFNLTVYGYCYQNPIVLVDPNGKQTVPITLGSVSAGSVGGGIGGGFSLGPGIVIVGLIILQYRVKQSSNRYQANKAKQQERQQQNATLKETKEAIIKEDYPIAKQDNLDIKNFAQHGKNNGKLESEELEHLKAKKEAGTLTKLEQQKLKKHEKNTDQRPSRQSKDKKK